MKKYEFCVYIHILAPHLSVYAKYYKIPKVWNISYFGIKDFRYETVRM